MTVLEASGHASILARRFTDAEELARAVRDAGIEYLPLDRGCYEARLMVLRIGSLHIQRAADRAHVARGLIGPGRVALLFSIRHHAPPAINGFLVEDDVLALAPGREFHGLCSAPVDWASVSLPTEDAEMLLELAGMPAMQRPAEPMLLVPREPAALVRRSVTEVTDLAERFSEAGATTGPADAFANGFMELCMEAFSLAERRLLRSRAARDAIRLLGAAEEYLYANIARPIYTDELCTALAVSPRTLHHAFGAACGMSPHTYLKRRRLMMAHQVLRSGGPEARLVKSVALAHGFWHLGNFAHDYREQFGQSPSDTLAERRAA